MSKKLKNERSEAPPAENYDFKVVETHFLPEAVEPIITNNLVICLCLDGTAEFEYDFQPVKFVKNEVAVILPNHPLKPIGTDDNYRVLLIYISYDYFMELKAKYLTQSFLKYRKHYALKLQPDKFGIIVDAIRILEKCLKVDLEDKKILYIRLISFITSIIDNLFTERTKSENVDHAGPEHVFDKFYVLLTENYTSNREIKFYAEKCRLTPKYFANLIKKETGTTAAQWISSFVILKAKTLLAYRLDLSIQQISDELGFSDQTSFSRYFHHNANMSPSEYRNSQTKNNS